MLAVSDIDLSLVLPIFSSIGLRVSFLVPTKTGLEKSIMDATSPLRDYFADTGFHVFADQSQGTENKTVRSAYFVLEQDLIETQVSMYRPSTKQGDPRIWFYRLSQYANPQNLLAVVVHEESLFVINCSNPAILNSIKNGKSPLFEILKIRPDGLSEEALELLMMLRQVAGRGWIQSLKQGDTGVGFTLETLLGISANSNRTPDYKGVEIKSSRKKSSSQSLFSKTPNWTKSRLKSTKHIFESRARFSKEKNRLQLFHSIYASKPNSYGMQLNVDFENELVTQFCLESGVRVDDVVWEFQVIQSALRKKHNQTFWIKTEVMENEGSEYFWYKNAEYTRGPNIDMLPILIAESKVYIDYTIWVQSNNVVTDQGYLFKMKRSNLDMLFGKPKIFDLTSSDESAA